MSCRRVNKRAARGIVLLVLLLILAIGAAGLMKAAEVWAFQQQRELENELLYVGDVYRKAIRSYYIATPGGVKTYPVKVEDLLVDDRFPVPQHHLRRAYPDPITNEPFNFVKLGDQIIGVVSKSKKKGIKKSGFSAPYTDFAVHETYDEWMFVFRPTFGGRASRDTRSQ